MIHTLGRYTTASFALILLAGASLPARGQVIVPGYAGLGYPGVIGGYGYPGVRYGGTFSGYGYRYGGYGYGYPAIAGYGYGYPYGVGYGGPGYGYGVGYGGLGSGYGYPGYPGGYANYPALATGLTPLAVQSAATERALLRGSGLPYGISRERAGYASPPDFGTYPSNYGYRRL